MFLDATTIDEFSAELGRGYRSCYPTREGDYPAVLEHYARAALEVIGSSDAPYHDGHQAVLGTRITQAILSGRQLQRGDVTPRGWLHAIVASLYRDVGYVRGICRGDRGGKYVIDQRGTCVPIAATATDAALHDHHVARGQVYVKERLAQEDFLDAQAIARNIDKTDLSGEDAQALHEDDVGAAVRGADLLAELADPAFHQRLPRLFAELVESGAAKAYGYPDIETMRRRHPTNMRRAAEPHINDALVYLSKSRAGQVWLASLARNSASPEIREFGPERRSGTCRRRGADPTVNVERRERSPGRRVGDSPD